MFRLMFEFSITDEGKGWFITKEIRIKGILKILAFPEKECINNVQKFQNDRFQVLLLLHAPDMESLHISLTRKRKRTGWYFYNDIARVPFCFHPFSVNNRCGCKAILLLSLYDKYLCFSCMICEYFCEKCTSLLSCKLYYNAGS